MAKQLVITEKPSVAKDIAKALGGFEDEGDYFESDTFVLTFAVGHLLQLAEPEDYDKALKGWTLAPLPIIPSEYRIKPKEGMKKRVDLIKKLGKRKDVTGLINACDAGREGEIIFRRIAEFTGLDKKPHQRLWLQSMTKTAIKTAFENLRPGDEMQPLADAAWLRGVGDWLIGMNATRSLTKRLKGRREKGAWSAGRVQTPTLGLLVLREREIFAHVPQTYWEVTAPFEHEGQSWEGRYYDESVKGSGDRNIRADRIFDRARVDAVLKAVSESAGGVASEKRRQAKQNPPLPFHLTSLQREANRRFSFTAKRTLQAAQRLYEAHKLLTYPRTDSRHLPDDYRETLDAVLDALGTDAEYSKLSQGIVANGPLNLEKIIDGSKVTDHFAIVPTGNEPPTTLRADDAKIYDLVVRQFLASMMGPATFDTVDRRVEVQVPGAQPAVFRTTAKSLEIPGYLEALGQEAGKGTTLPALVPGEKQASGVGVTVGIAADEEKETRPPARYSEAQLLRLMETAGDQLDDEDLSEVMAGRGLGTPATRADIIDNLVRKMYARRVDGKLGATPKGMRLIDVLERADVPTLASPRLTGEWEHNLKRVETGELSREAYLEDLETFTRNVTDIIKAFDHDELFGGPGPLGPCPSCGEGVVVESAWGYRCSRNEGKDGPCKLILWKERSGRYIDRALATKLIHEKQSGKITGFVSRDGHELTGSILLEPEENAPAVQWTMTVTYGDGVVDGGPEVRGDVLFPCPCEDDSCGGVVETNRRYVCQRLLDKEVKAGPILPRKVCEREMSVEEAAAFFSEAGRTETLDGFTSRRNRPFRGLLFRKPTGKHGFEFPPRPKKAKKKSTKKKASTRKKAASKKKASTRKKAATKKGAAPRKSKPRAKKAAAKKTASPGDTTSA